MKIRLEYNEIGEVKATDIRTNRELNEAGLSPAFRTFYSAIEQAFQEQMSVLTYSIKRQSQIPIGKLEIELELRSDEH
jgi:hypothetical protein